MPPSNPVSPKRFLHLLATALAIPLGVWFLLGLYTRHFAGTPSTRDEPQKPDPAALLAAAKEEQRRGLVQLAPNTPADHDATPLQPGDEFFRQRHAGTAGDPGALGVGPGEGLGAAVIPFVHRGDVLAREVVNVQESGGGRNIFVGKYESSWSETIHWCLRLHYAPGQENAFAHALWKLSHEAFGDSLGLPALAAGADVTPANASQFLDPAPWQNLLLAMSTHYWGNGRYARHAPYRSWQIEPQSHVCDAARRQGAAPGTVAIAPQ